MDSEFVYPESIVNVDVRHSWSEVFSCRKSWDDSIELVDLFQKFNSLIVLLEEHSWVTSSLGENVTGHPSRPSTYYVRTS